MPGPVLTFDGMNAAQSGCNCLPSDSDGDVGPNNYVNVVNTSIKIFDKSGNPLNGANGTTFNSFFHDLGAGNPCGKAGNGAIPDSSDAAVKAKLQTIADSAAPGLTTTDLAAAQKAAQSTADAIGAAK